MTCSSNKLSVFILIFLSAFIANTQASCWRYGHSCWGGHGKRSGGGGGSGRGSGVKRVEESLGERNLGNRALDGSINTNPVFQFDEVSLVPSSGSDSGTEGVEEPMISAAFGSFEPNLRDLLPRRPFAKPFNTHTGNDVLYDKIPAFEKQDDNGGDEEPSAVELYDYDHQTDDSLVQPKLQLPLGKRENHEKILLGFNRDGGFDGKSHSLDSMEELKRTADVSTRKHPLNNLFMYKLIRLRRRK